MLKNQFYTFFLLVYFPFGLILYDILHIQFIDEILVLLLVLYTFVFFLKVRRKVTKEIKCVLFIFLAYLLYSILIKTTSVKANLLDFQQQIKPYIAFYSTLYLGPIFTSKQRCLLNIEIKLLVLLSLVIICIGKAKIFFGEPLAALATTISTLALFYYYFSFQADNSKRNSFLIMSVGLLSGKAKFMGEYVIAIYLFFRKKVRLDLFSLKSVAIFFICLMSIVYVIWDKLNFYFIEGMQNSEDIARPLLYKTSLDIFKDYFPLGPGFGTFCNEASRSVYSPLYYEYNLQDVWGLTPENPAFAADCFYPTLSQFGIVGVILFFLFWRQCYMQIQKIKNEKNYIIGKIIIVILLFESIADTTYLSNRGVPFFILLALVISSSKKQLKTSTKRL